MPAGSLRFGIATLLAAATLVPLPAAAELKVGNRPLGDRWVFTMLTPETGLDCALVVRPLRGGPAVVLLGMPRSRSGPLSMFIMAGQRAVPAHALRVRWSSGGEAIDFPAWRSAADSARFDISDETDPGLRSARFLQAPSSLVVSGPESQPVFDLALGQVARSVVVAFATCVRDPSAFPPDVAVRDDG